MEQTLDTIAERLKGRVIGNGATRISGVNNLEAAQEGELTFAEGPKHLARAVATSRGGKAGRARCIASDSRKPWASAPDRSVNTRRAAAERWLAASVCSACGTGKPAPTRLAISRAKAVASSGVRLRAAGAQLARRPGSGTITCRSC